MMSTYGGPRIDPQRMVVGDVKIRSIARALSMLCRYAGHVKKFYSVAEHSVHVSRAVNFETDGDLRLAGLLHDATEAYVCDLPTDLKHLDALAGYRAIEDRLQKVIFAALDVRPFNLPPAVKRADKRVARNEALAILDPVPEWAHDERYPPYTFLHISAWDPAEAEEQFMRRYMELTKVRRVA